MKKSYLQSIYKYDQLTDSYQLEISIDNYHELFNAWDASPIKKKDLNPELAEYLKQASIDIPIKEKINIVFLLPKRLRSEPYEHKAQKAFQNYYNANVHFINQTLKSDYKKILSYLFIGFLFVTSTYFLESNSIAVSFDILNEGLFIGGWVFLWEAFSLFFFEINDKINKRKRHLRFAKTVIIFKYI